ncbi:P-loop containing nucleoside triphosphate hydrolase protein [Baffinella frigidus]|nr:P-loop containing nucleoside triphosphate hydrolase protein [Cryptophyta sp. CCMP2293]
MGGLRAGDRVWVWEAESWAEANVVAHMDGGRVRVRGQGGREMTAKADQVFAAAAVGQDSPDSLAALPSVNLPSTLHALRLRFNAGSMCTSAGRVVVAFASGVEGHRMGQHSLLSNSYGSQQRPGQEGASTLAGRLHATASDALVRMRASNRAQTLVLCGEAGAGKSLAARMLVAALASAADAPPELGRAIERAHHLLATLTSAPTLRSRASTHAVSRRAIEQAHHLLATLTSAPTLRSRASSRAALSTTLSFSPSPSPPSSSPSAPSSSSPTALTSSSAPPSSSSSSAAAAAASAAPAALTAATIDAALPDFAITLSAAAAAGLPGAARHGGAGSAGSAGGAGGAGGVIHAGAPRVFALLGRAARSGRGDVFCEEAARALPGTSAAGDASDATDAELEDDVGGDATDVELEEMLASLRALRASDEDLRGVARALGAVALLSAPGDGRMGDAAVLLQCPGLAVGDAAVLLQCPGLAVWPPRCTGSW